jgi:hypothetical protein
VNKIVNLSREERRELWSSASRQLQPLPDFMIEKDFWVCFALQHLFALPGARHHFISRAELRWPKFGALFTGFSRISIFR